MKQEQKTIECCGNPVSFEFVKGQHSSSSYQKEYGVCSECGLGFERKRGSNIAYKQNREEGGANCTECGTVILGVKVAHPVWEFPEMMAGFGECRYEMVPFCPKCEKEPNFHGEPIRGG
jgi:hypothetical protein